MEQNPLISINELYQEAEDQWRLSDLSDSGIECLPNKICASNEIQTIDGFYAVQLQWLIKINQSPYDQYQQIYGKEVDIGKEQQEFKTQNNFRDSKKTDTKRVLKLTLSDGHKNVIGLEYSPIPCLSTKLAPGIKILISGKIRCVNHILMLEAQNVRILGGEVGSLAIEFAYENVLLRALDKPINPNPKLDYQEDATAEVATSREFILPAKPMQSIQTVSQQQLKPVVKASSTPSLDEQDDDDIFCDIDIDHITAVAASQSNRTTSTANLGENSKECEQQSRPNTSTESSSTSSSRTNTATNNENVCDKRYPFKLRGINLATIDQMIFRTDAEKNEIHYLIVKAEIDSIIENANVSHMKWSLGVLLTDRLSKMQFQVRFSDTVLEKLAGASARETQEMYAQRKTRPQLQHDIEKVKILSYSMQ